MLAVRDEGAASSSSDGQDRCPSPALLEASCHGTLSLADLSQLDQHAANCPACSAALVQLMDAAALEGTPGKKNLETPGLARGKVVDSANRPLGEARVQSSGQDDDRLTAGSTAPLQLGPYRLVRRIGMGGMGVVYKAWHDRLKRHVAIKFLPPSKLSSQPDIDRLHQEMAAVGNLRHDNVVFAIDADECEGVHYLVMEYVEGCNLEKLVARHGPLKIADACELMRQAAVGMAHVHEQGLVHRDIKPSNMMLDIQGKVKILDLGLARLRSDKFLEHRDLTCSGYLMGTADYLAPEQAADAQAADIRSDLYSLGCAFFKLLTGQAPFGGKQYDSLTKKIIAHAKTPPPRLAEFRTDVPPEIEALLSRLLEKDPALRPADPRELIPILKRFSTGHRLHDLIPGGAAPESGMDRSAHSISTKGLIETPRKEVKRPVLSVRTAREFLSRQHPWAVTSGVTALLAFLVLGGWLSFQVIGSWLGPETPSFNHPEDFVPMDYHLSVRPSGLAVKERDRSISLRSPDPVLLKLGNLGPRTGKFSVACDHSQGDWAGQFGIFMGAHDHHDAEGRPSLVAQFICVNMAWETDDKGMRLPRDPRLMVQRIYYTLARPTDEIGLVPTPSKAANSPYEYVDIPPVGQKLHLELHFQDGLLTQVLASGKVLPRLTAGDFHDRMAANDTQGPLGVFVANRLGATFSKFDFSVLQRD